ncbi:unnamed protein product, partial [Mesorhabditis belari]|uniref:Alpha-taxilin n=1 Tax=Mesorhabditis belari TaxID=2138241 RepID=A0AAF3J7L2_9BILA
MTNKKRGNVGPSTSTASVSTAPQISSPAETPTTSEGVLKKVDGLNDEGKINKLVELLVKAENDKTAFSKKAQNFDKLQKAFQQQEKKCDKANEILIKTEASKSKLEELCRELQKCNKEIREESLTRTKKLESERQEAVNQLRFSLKEIEKNMNEGRSRSDTLAEDNKRLSEKLSELGTQYEDRLNNLVDSYKKKEEYWADLEKARDCEVNLLKTKLQHAGLLQQKSANEKEELTRSLLEGTRRVGEAIENESTLREQVKQYSARYTELANSLSQSSEAFDKFKSEIERVNTQLKKVEMEAQKWRIKYEESNRSILLMTVQKQEIEERAASFEKKVGTLENLCRALTQRSSGETEKKEDNTDASS